MLKEYQVLPGASQPCANFKWQRNLDRQSLARSSIRLMGSTFSFNFMKHLLVVWFGKGQYAKCSKRLRWWSMEHMYYLSHYQ